MVGGVIFPNALRTILPVCFYWIDGCTEGFRVYGFRVYGFGFCGKQIKAAIPGVVVYIVGAKVWSQLLNIL